MVVSMKEEQSERRLVRGGLALAAVPPTPRRQLFGLQALARSRSTLLSAMLAAARVRKSEAFILEDELLGVETRVEWSKTKIGSLTWFRKQKPNKSKTPNESSEREKHLGLGFLKYNSLHSEVVRIWRWELP
jgi:hypothetical protein